ncbi:MAG: response regulator [Candidatus Omnitrophica bacterium]|nr:response regulator [Candidatus Omnitrophota bacterium]
MLKKIKILVVDDEPGWCDLLAFELSGQGYEVVTASDAGQGLKILHEQSFDLVITDIRMPHMDGVQMIETFHKENPDQKVIFITGYAVEGRLEEAYRHSLSCLKKPFYMDELIKTVSQALDAIPPSAARS